MQHWRFWNGCYPRNTWICISESCSNKSGKHYSIDQSLLYAFKSSPVISVLSIGLIIITQFSIAHILNLRSLNFWIINELCGIPDQYLIITNGTRYTILATIQPYLKLSFSIIRSIRAILFQNYIYHKYFWSSLKSNQPQSQLFIYIIRKRKGPEYKTRFYIFFLLARLSTAEFQTT